MPFPLVLPKPTAKHRLFIAFPMFLALLGVSIASGATADIVRPLESVSGTVLTIDSRPETVILANSIAARLLPGTIVVRDDVTPIVSEGEGVFAAAGCFTVSVGGFVTESCGGAIHVKRQNDSIAISALTSPVLVHASGGTVLVPVHRTWTAPETLHGLEQGMQRWVTERTTQKMTADALRIQLPVATDLLSETPKVDAQSLQSFASTSTGWLLAAFHPSTRDLAWTLPQPTSMTKELHLLSLVSFLPADILPEAYSTVAFDRWSQSLQMYLSAENDVSIRVMIEEQAKTISAEDMPERQERALRLGL